MAVWSVSVAPVAWRRHVFCVTSYATLNEYIVTHSVRKVFPYNTDVFDDAIMSTTGLKCLSVCTDKLMTTNIKIV